MGFSAPYMDDTLAFLVPDHRRIEICRRNGTLDRLYDHWILGRSPEADSRRWSVIRDVLHWVD